MTTQDDKPETIEATITLPAAVIQLWCFASDDDQRYNLWHIQIRPRGNGYEANATDGHRLTRITWPRSEGDTLDRDVYVEGADLKALAKLSKKLAATCHGGNAHVGGGISVPLALYATPGVGKQFPDSDQIFRVLGHEAYKREPIGINPVYLAEALDHAVKYVNGVPGASRKCGAVVMDLDKWGDSLAPTLFTAYEISTDLRAEYIIMPMRI